MVVNTDRVGNTDGMRSLMSDDGLSLCSLVHLPSQILIIEGGLRGGWCIPGGCPGTILGTWCFDVGVEAIPRDVRGRDVGLIGSALIVW